MKTRSVLGALISASLVRSRHRPSRAVLLGAALILPAASGLAPAAELLINVDAGTTTENETGFAAIGQTTNDVWNPVITKYQAFGLFTNLLAADGTATTVSFALTNTPGDWYHASSDAMYYNYSYAYQGETASAAIRNLPQGSYDLLLYGGDTSFHVQVGASDYGTLTSTDNPIVTPTIWQEGKQYVRFHNLAVDAGQDISITLLPGPIGNYAVLAGLQILGQAQPVPRRATATAQVVNGFVVGATITDGGCGYTNAPAVVIEGGGGTGAIATAVVSNGVVLGITIWDAGRGYTSTPTVYIYSPFGFQIGLIKAVRPFFSDLLIGTNYQLQVSGDLSTWTNSGSPFSATDRNMAYPQYWDVDNWNQLFFRLLAAGPTGR